MTENKEQIKIPTNPMTQTAEEQFEYIFNKYQEWCKLTHRNGAVLIGSSIKEFFKWIAGEYAAQFQQPTGDYEKEANKEFPNWGIEDNMRSEDNFTHNEIAMLERAAYIKGCMRNLGPSIKSPEIIKL